MKLKFETSISLSYALFFFQDIPIVIVANKIDLVREVDSVDVISWIESDLPRLRYASIVIPTLSLRVNE